MDTDSVESLMSRAMAREVPGPAGAPDAGDAPAPADLKASGLSRDLVVELLLRHLLRAGERTVGQLSASVGLPGAIVDPILAFMRSERLAEVPRRGSFDADTAYVLTEAGRARAHEAFRKCQYVGPAPVTLADYQTRILAQRASERRIDRDVLLRSLGDLVIGEELIREVGAALNSDLSMFLYGPSGSGKTFLAERLAGVLQGAVWVPHALVVDDQLVQVFDPIVHVPVAADADEGGLARGPRSDGRWILCRRPVVKTGGELTVASLDLAFDHQTRFYRAPAQLKANNGLLVIDDLGRQRDPVHEILNRWIVPLDRRIDYLTLHTGTSVPVPFDVSVVFSSNLSPSTLADPAFVRRLGYKIFVGEMSVDDYRRVFAQACVHLGVPHDPVMFDYLVGHLHRRQGTPLLPAYPADLVRKVRDFARFTGTEPRLSRDALDWAWQLYFAPDRDTGGQR
jgi:energy-coupling factor transporter ATP-binding protein EcfA2